VKVRRNQDQQLADPGRREAAARKQALQVIEYEFYSDVMSSLAPDRLLSATDTEPATPPAHGGRLTADEETAAATELTQAAPVFAALLAECAGLALGYGEHLYDATRYRQITGLCIAAGVDQTLIETWVEVGRRRASAGAALIHKACVLWDS